MELNRLAAIEEERKRAEQRKHEETQLKAHLQQQVAELKIKEEEGQMLKREEEVLERQKIIVDSAVDYINYFVLLSWNLAWCANADRPFLLSSFVCVLMLITVSALDILHAVRYIYNHNHQYSGYRINSYQNIREIPSLYQLGIDVLIFFDKCDDNADILSEKEDKMLWILTAFCRAIIRCFTIVIIIVLGRGAQ